jgi:nonribosomal peptide synthetase DhbF
MKRISQSLDDYGLWSEKFRDRIVPVCGDLAEPSLGLATESYSSLAAGVELILHNGARVNHALPYANLRNANVMGVQEIFRLATTGRIKQVHYISTLGTAVAGPGDPESLLGASGYIRSKWVAEGIVRLARDRGIPVAIYRLARVCGDSRTGVMGFHDAFWHYIGACIQLAARPLPDNAQAAPSENMVPVDFVAKTILQLIFNQPPDGAVYSICALSNVEWDTILDVAHSTGYRMEQIPYEEWMSRLEESARQGQVSDRNSLLTVALLKTARGDEAGRSPRHFDRSSLLRVLAGPSITCDPIDSQLVERHLSYFARTGFLPKPSHSTR